MQIMKQIFNLCSVLILLTLANCASVIRLPSSTGQIPEVSGGFLSGRTGASIGRQIPVSIINDITTNPVTRSDISVGADRNVVGQALGVDYIAGIKTDLNLGLLEKLDVYYTDSLGLRFQLFGDPGQTGWRATAFAGYFDSSQINSVEDSIVHEANTSLGGYEYGFSFGYRRSEKSLLYLTTASRGGQAKVAINQNHVNTETYHDQFEHYLATLGLLYGQRWYVKAELGANYILWRGSDATGTPLKGEGFEQGLSIGLGYRWGVASR